VTRHARQELVRRLDSYEHAAPERFREVASFIQARVVPVIVRHALAGRCVVETGEVLFADAMAVDMVLDTLAERGYHAFYEERRTPVPKTFDPKTGAIAVEDRVTHAFEIRFHSPELRRGH
jgi:adenylate kinase